VIRSKFEKEWYRFPSTIRFFFRYLRGCDVSILQKGNLCDYYAEMSSSAFIFIASFVKIDSTIQKLTVRYIYRHIQTAGRSYKRTFLKIMKVPDKVIFQIYLILPAALGPGVYSASNRNEYQKHKNNVSGR
jgi:hypothetical protein